VVARSPSEPAAPWWTFSDRNGGTSLVTGVKIGNPATYPHGSPEGSRMSETSAATVDATPVSLELEQGGRRFPADWRSSQPLRKNRVQQLHEQKQPLPELLTRILWERLAWSELPEAEQDRQTLVETYIRSLSVLDQFRRDVENLVRAA